jgi:RPA family protein
MIILFLSILAVAQIKMAGMNVKDFWTFIKANETLDKLYAFAIKYEKLSPQQQIIFLKEADEIFAAFDKVPDALWEEDYQKYMKILDKYEDIKVLRWESSK